MACSPTPQCGSTLWARGETLEQGTLRGGKEGESSAKREKAKGTLSGLVLIAQVLIRQVMIASRSARLETLTTMMLG
eukprot:14400108-Alexandrium_andersonii.AAC.1